MQCRLRKNVKRVESAGVNAEGVLRRLGFDTMRRKCLALDQGPTYGGGQKAAYRDGTVSRCGVNTARGWTTPSNFFINGSQSPFCTIVSRHSSYFVNA